MGFCVIRTRRSTSSAPVTEPILAAAGSSTSSADSCAAALPLVAALISCSAVGSAWVISVDLPDPDTPVTAVNVPSPRRKSTPWIERAWMSETTSSPVGVREVSLSCGAGAASARAVA